MSVYRELLFAAVAGTSLVLGPGLFLTSMASVSGVDKARVQTLTDMVLKENSYLSFTRPGIDVGLKLFYRD